MNAALFMDDPDWANFLPELKSGGARCRMPAHADCSPVEPDDAARHLRPGGTLGKMRGYEARPGQLDMLRAVTRAYNNREHLMIEAGTGVGKSLAYLVPSVLWSFLNDTPVVVSTNTRNLQSQLISKDLPRAVSVLGDDAAKMRVTVLKGRANYLCLRALDEAMSGGWFTFTDDERADFERLVEWLRRTPDGDLDDAGCELLRPRLTCPGEDCLGHACRFHSRCFIAKARDRALKAHVVVANHALVLAESAGSGGILPPFGRLVFDEAHNLEDVATDFFSYRLSRPALAALAAKITRSSKPARRGLARKRGVLGTVERQLEKGTLAQNPAVRALVKDVSRAQVQCRLALAEGDALFAVLERLFAPAPKADRIRYRCIPAGTEVGFVRQHSLHGLFADYTPEQWDEAELDAAVVRFERALARLQKALADIADGLDTLAADAGQEFLEDIATQVRTVVQAVTDFILESKFVLAADDASRVYWAERCPGDARRRRDPYLCLTAAPLTVAEEMKRCFYDLKDSVVLCSATLRVGDRFDYMARRLGCALCEPERVRTLVAASPFDYLRQTLMLAPDFLPDPAARDAGYAEALAPFLVGLFRAVKGRALVLFTSYEMMRATARHAEAACAAAGFTLLVQGDGLTREAMVDGLKRAAPERPVVLFGAQSFWEGVDVPGPALSCVVLARLPFPQVGEPIVEARGDRIKEEGGSPFRDYMLPEAVIRFRQGVGRLVRAKSDRGVVVIADSRVCTKNYGALFRRATSATVHTVSTPAETFSRAAAFFEP